MEDFPVRPELVTTDWLSNALGLCDGPAQLASVTVVSEHSGTTGRARLGLEWRGEVHADLPRTVFLKLPPVDSNQQAMVVAEGMGVREARFYRELAEHVPARTLQSYYSNWSDDGSRYLMVMEDIRATGGRPAGGRSDRTMEVAEQLMDALGAVHASYWGSPLFDAELSWIQPFSIRSPYGKQLIGGATKEFAEQMPPVFLAAASLYCEQNLALAQLFESGVPTLIHGDLHMGNLFLDGDGRVGFFDWALVSRMPGMWDVAYVLCNSFPTEFRREHQAELLRRYCERLSASGGPSRSFDEVWDEYRLYALYPWIAAAATLGAGERMQSREVALRALQWSHAALEDLEVIGYIQHRLSGR